MAEESGTQDLLKDIASLDRVSRRLVALAREEKIGPVYVRQKLVEEGAQQLVNGNNLMLVGEPGVGKNAIVESMAMMIAAAPEGQAPWDEIAETTPTDLQLGCFYVANLENKIEYVLDNCEVAHAALFVDNIHQGIGAGAATDDPFGDVVYILSNLSLKRDVPLICATTRYGWNSLEKLRGEFTKRFFKLEVPPTSRKETETILRKVRLGLEEKHDVRIDEGLIPELVRLCDRFIHWRASPGREFEILHEIIAATNKKTITARDVVSALMARSGLPESMIREDKPLKVKDVQQYFKDEIFGQDDAVNEVVEAIIRLKTGLNEPKKPVSVFMFQGPSGVGKTYLAKVLASYIYGSDERMFVYPMSSFKGEKGYTALLGSASSKKGGEAGATGQLLADQRGSHFSVVVLDEIDQASDDVIHALYNILDEGYFIEMSGEVTSFRSSIIVMSTNIGMEAIFAHKPPGFITNIDEGGIDDEVKQRIASAIEQRFGYAFANRCKVVFFNRLDKSIIEAIAKKTMDNLSDVLPGLARRNLIVKVRDRLFKFIVKNGYNDRYGARVMQRTVLDYVVNPVANYISENPDVSDRTLYVTMNADGQVEVKTR